MADQVVSPINSCKQMVNGVGGLADTVGVGVGGVGGMG